jgi:hypothetical protein
MRPCRPALAVERRIEAGGRKPVCSGELILFESLFLLTIAIAIDEVISVYEFNKAPAR